MSIFDPIRPYLSAIKLVVFAIIIGAAFFYGRGCGKQAGEAVIRATEVKQARAEAKAALESKRLADVQAARYQTRSESMAATATQYQEALKDANRKHDRTVADLRAGNLRLRQQWRGCPVPTSGEATPSESGTDEDADLRADDSGNLVRAGAQCDAWIKTLQQTLRDERAP